MADSLFASETSWLNSSQTAALAQNGCNHFKYLAYTVTYSSMFPIGLFSNLMALIIFLRFTPKKSANTVFMTNLALSDVCFSLTLPFRLIYYHRECDWDFWDWLCRWCVYSFYVNLYTSVLFLTGVSVLRYLAIVHPLRSKPFVTTRRASFACLGIWVFVASVCTPFLMSGTVQIQGKNRCFEPINIKHWTQILSLNYLALVLGFLIPFIVILACYGLIIRKLFADNKVHKNKQTQRWRSVYLIFVILSTFLLCFMPYHVVRTLHLKAIVENEEQGFLLKVLVVSLCTAAANSCLNPLLYYFAGVNFRTTFRSSLRSVNGSFRKKISRRPTVRS